MRHSSLRSAPLILLLGSMVIFCTTAAASRPIHSETQVLQREQPIGAAHKLGIGQQPTFLPLVQSWRSTSVDCIVSSPPPSLGLDPFYTKYCALLGLPIISAGVVPDAALKQSYAMINIMLAKRPDLIKSIAGNGTRLGIIGQNQVTTDMPEYHDLYTQFPGTDWNVRTRGVSATFFIRLSSAAEENILCYPSDRYRGESILVHEFAHTIKIMGIEPLDSQFKSNIQGLYQTALASGKWANTYAATDAEEYWAEGVQSYFNTNLQAIPADGIHNFVNTRAELELYDPALFAAINQAFGDLQWTPGCP